MNPHEIEQAAVRLRGVDGEILNASLTQSFARLGQLIEEFRNLMRRLHVAQIDTAVVPISSAEARSVLRQLREGRPFHADQMLELRDASSGDQIPIDELTDDEVDQLGSDMFYSWFSHYEYIRSLYRLGALIATATIPRRNQRYLEEVRQCYAFQQYNAVLALCRAFIEATARDICAQLGLIGSDTEAVIHTDERRFSPLIGAIAKGQLRRRANTVYYGLASPVVHGTRTVTEVGAREAIRATLALVEDLYHAQDLCG